MVLGLSDRVKFAPAQNFPPRTAHVLVQQQIKQKKCVENSRIYKQTSQTTYKNRIPSKMGGKSSEQDSFKLMLA